MIEARVNPNAGPTRLMGRSAAGLFSLKTADQTAAILKFPLGRPDFWTLGSKPANIWRRSHYPNIVTADPPPHEPPASHPYPP